MSGHALLPPNATTAERNTSLALDQWQRLGAPAGRIVGLKHDPVDALLPWLIWEYALGPLLPYLRDHRRALREGIQWQRLRGTPESLRIALRWVGLDEVALEQEPPGVHFAEFQFDPGRVLRDDALIADLIGVAKLAAPARSRLSRIYHGYDLRRCILSQCQTGGCLLSDYSGTVWAGDGFTRLSFGETHQGTAAQPSATDQTLIHAPDHTARARMIDRFILDYSRLGGRDAVRNPHFMHAHLFAISARLQDLWPLGLWPDREWIATEGLRPLLPERRFCKAMVVLSDSTPLGDINACTPRFHWEERGKPIQLGAGESLSESTHRLVRAETLERHWRAHAAEMSHGYQATAFAAIEAGNCGASVLIGAHQLGSLQLGQARVARNWPLIRSPLITAAASNTTAWPATAWPAQNWVAPQLTAPVPRPRTFQRAQIVLSETGALGATHARTPRASLIVVNPSWRLGELQLGDAPELRAQTLTELHDRDTGAGAAYESLHAPTSQARLIGTSVPVALIGSALGVLRLGDTHPAPWAPSATRAADHAGAAAYHAWPWLGAVWPPSPWTRHTLYVGAAHRTETA